MFSKDTGLFRSVMNEDELINFFDQVEFILHLKP